MKRAERISLSLPSAAAQDDCFQHISRERFCNLPTSFVYVIKCCLLRFLLGKHTLFLPLKLQSSKKVKMFQKTRHGQTAFLQILRQMEFLQMSRQMPFCKCYVRCLDGVLAIMQYILSKNTFFFAKHKDNQSRKRVQSSFSLSSISSCFLDSFFGLLIVISLPPPSALQFPSSA